MKELLNILDPISLIHAVGLLGIFLVVFAESGIFVGFFLPGDSLLFTSGLLASQGILNIYTLVPVVFVAAILGDNIGYTFGRKIGIKIFTKEDSIFFHKDHIARAQHFYEKYGKKTIVLARFIPVVRTFAPILAGVGGMSYRTFLVYNIVGAFFWAVGLTLAGYLLGNLVPNVDKYLFPIIGGIILLSFLPVIREVFHILKEKHKK